MDTRLLEYFVTIAAEESVTEAAATLHAAQSTVSVGLRNLERDLGVRLFERSTRSVRISAAGEQLLPEARAILDGMERMRAMAGESTSGIRGRLKIGTFTAMEQWQRLPETLAAFRAAYPGVDVTLGVSHSGSVGLSEDLIRGRLDLAFFALPPGPELETVELTSAPYVGLVPPGHALAERESVSLAELVDEPWVDVSPGYGNRVQMEGALRERGLARHVAAEVPALPSVPQFVAAGVGVAVVPDVVEPGGCAVVNIVDALPPWRLALAMRRGYGQRPHVIAFVEILREKIRSAR